jgi:uncharacterized membrane protein YcaP (DUF421 family)
MKPMAELWSVDWERLFVPSMSLLELVLRGTLVYIVLFTLIRVVLRREAGTVGMADLLMIVLLADAAQNAMADNYHSITDGIVLVSTIIFWNYIFDYLDYKFPALRPFFHPKPLLLVQDGRLVRSNMRKELVSYDELIGQMREHGIDDLKNVKAAYMEADGQISMIKHDSSDDADAPQDRRPMA